MDFALWPFLFLPMNIKAISIQVLIGVLTFVIADIVIEKLKNNTT
tara:strand:+ start:66 stop:200 length:135 start_codon:yes stop_codon:yes gene_type:complete